MQAIAPNPHFFGEEAFEAIRTTQLRWLGGSGALVNSRGTTVMIDPVLSGFDMPLLIEMPIREEQIPGLDGILLTHCDGDHYSQATCGLLKEKVRQYHATHYVRSLLEEELGIGGFGHGIGEHFSIGSIRVTTTPADHAWQNALVPGRDRDFLPQDCCGFWLDTPDGSIWAVGDSRLMEEHLHMPRPDAILFDFSDDSWHIGLEGALKLAAAYPDTPLILWHWGTVDAPDMKPFNADPQNLIRRVVNPERVVILAPGELYTLQPRK